jgi:SAM-dependent methyltransferase
MAWPNLVEIVSSMNEKLRDRSIEDFGEQWSYYQGNDGYYGSIEMLQDIVGPDVACSAFQGMSVLDIGSGTGRIVKMLLAAGAAHVTAVEPSKAFGVLQRNVSGESGRVTCLNLRGDQIPADLNVDFAVSIGVLHHIPDPDPVVVAMRNALRPGGRIVVWLYGREGNALYLSIVERLRGLTKRLPHPLLAGFCHALNFWLGIYAFMSGYLPLPMRSYMRKVIWPLSRAKRYLVIYDQLNPGYSKYYSRSEAFDLLHRNGFSDISLYHRHSYSWTVSGVRSEITP